MTRRVVVLEAARKLASCPVVAAASMETGAADAQLIRDCAAFDALERLARSICSSGATVEEDLACGREIDRISARQAPILRRIVATPAHTRRGIQAKASSLALWDQEEFKAETTCWSRLLVRSLILDLLETAQD